MVLGFALKKPQPSMFHVIASLTGKNVHFDVSLLFFMCVSS